METLLLVWCSLLLPASAASVAWRGENLSIEVSASSTTTFSLQLKASR